MATRVCESLARRLRESERSLATADADKGEREATEAEVQTEALATLAGEARSGAAGSSAG